jgi:predicted nucleic acid-binding protein
MSEKIKRVYVDSTVVYGAPDKKYKEASRRFWDAVRNGKIVILTSDVLDEELKRATQYIRDFLSRLSESCYEHVVSTPESNALAKLYVDVDVVGESSFDDCRHIALATIENVDAIVAWNFEHIVRRQAGYNEVNAELGYPRIEILTPEQFMEAHYGKA